MFFDLVDTLQKKRRLVYVAVFVVADVWLLMFCTQILQAHRADITARIHSSQSAQALADYTLAGGSNLTASLDRLSNSMEVGVLRATVATTDAATKTERALQTAGRATLHASSVAALSTVHAVGQTTIFAWHVAIFPYVAMGHGIAFVSNTANSHFASVIKPKNDIAVPVITAEQAQQAYLIQSGTLSFDPITPTGSGGACDSGAGNGGYPMDWCATPMDTARTISYSTDRINRECTSYAYWYFTTIEGHFDFHVSGNADRWAYTSNYPVHAAPTVGAIAVETAGAYGHVAIVQALPGQIYDGKAVPAGYVLVSEMNYDWQGHFRYSYSPLAKFSAYIY
jgi:CHAP domain